MSIIINPLAEIAKILVSPLIRQIGYLISSKSNARDLALENERLKARRSDLMREVEAAERNGNMATSEAQVWFKRAEDLQKEADKLLWGGVCANCPSNYKLGKNAAKQLPKVTADIDGANSVHWTMDAPPQLGREMPMAPFTGQTSLEKNVNEILNFINNDELCVIGIVGMGGVGKTPLMHHVNNHLLETQ
ncbi:hypothetical protein AMTRI_Chr02g214700 [Amborella trichopoda]